MGANLRCATPVAALHLTKWRETAQALLRSHCCLLAAQKPLRLPIHVVGMLNGVNLGGRSIVALVGRLLLVLSNPAGSWTRDHYLLHFVFLIGLASFPLVAEFVNNSLGR